MAFIDGTVINIALPVMQKALAMPASHAQWVVDAYLLLLSSLLLSGGALGDHFGRLRIFATGIAIFALASAWCGAAPDSTHLILARALQGVGGALLVPGSLAIITAAFPKSERGKAIGTWSAMTSLAIIAGPPAGGWLVQTISWRAVFYINLPIAAATLVLAWRIRGEGGEREEGRVDWIGTILITIALAALTYALIEHAAWWMYAISGAACIAFVAIELRVNNPLIPLALFRSRSFTMANALTLFLYAALSALTYLLPFELIQKHHDSPARAGAAFLPLMVTLSLLSRWTGAIADRIGARPLLVTGPLFVAAGLFALSRTQSMLAMLVVGIGMALTVAPLTTAVMTSIGDEHHAGAASGINNAVSRVGGMLAIAALGRDVGAFRPGMIAAAVLAIAGAASGAFVTAPSSPSIER